MKRVLVAVGGNSLTRFNEVGTVEEQFHNARITCQHLSGLIARGSQLVVTHGNGPQVGNLIRRIELTANELFPMSLDVVSSMVQGAMGYMLQQVLKNALTERGVQRRVSTFVCQTLVDPGDPAFDNPQKGVGRFYTPEEAASLIAENGWEMKDDAGRGWRRMVPSPKPIAIVEADAIRQAVDEVVPIAVGGGGIPVCLEGNQLVGVEAVVDKDAASAILARDLDCDTFIILTAVPTVEIGHGTPKARAVNRLGVSEADELLAAGEFPAGSMGPKIESALTFLRSGGGRVLITDPESLDAALDGQGGTWIAE